MGLFGGVALAKLGDGAGEDSVGSFNTGPIGADAGGVTGVTGAGATTGAAGVTGFGAAVAGVAMGVAPLVSNLFVGIAGGVDANAPATGAIFAGVVPPVATDDPGPLYDGGVDANAPAFAIVGDVVTLGVSNAPAAGVLGVAGVTGVVVAWDVKIFFIAPIVWLPAIASCCNPKSL